MLHFGQVKARNHPGFTFQHHYNEYRQLEPEGYSYTQFMGKHTATHLLPPRQARSTFAGKSDL